MGKNRYKFSLRDISAPEIEIITSNPVRHSTVAKCVNHLEDDIFLVLSELFIKIYIHVFRNQLISQYLPKLLCDSS